MSLWFINLINLTANVFFANSQKPLFGGGNWNNSVTTFFLGLGVWVYLYMEHVRNFSRTQSKNLQFFDGNHEEFGTCAKAIDAKD